MNELQKTALIIGAGDRLSAAIANNFSELINEVNHFCLPNLE